MRFLPASGLAVLLLAAAVPADAHAIIVAAEPAIGAVLHGSKVEVKLRFNSRIDAERSRLTLTAPDGTARPLALAPSDAPDTLAATIGGLASGSYRLRWQVLAIDGHITRGDIPFTVAR
jgi:methionine-rich copper-binding protein CopC